MKPKDDKSLTIGEKIAAILLVFWIPIFLAIVSVFCGCTTEYTGSRTVVGEEIAWPEISDESGLVKVRVFQSIKGAKVWTAKDCKVTANYTNAYTNSYFFNTVVLRDVMTLNLEIEPLSTDTLATTNTAGSFLPDKSACGSDSLTQ